MKDLQNKTPENEPRLLGVLLTSFFLFFVWMLARSEGYVGDADSLTHYKFSRYSWQFPEFLLHHWGKPVFTLLSSPFAQFGYEGVSVFNLLAGIGSSWLAWLSARRLGYSYRLMLPFLLFFTPIYTLLVISGQVEVLFGFFIIATVYLCLDKKYLWAAVLISFSPLVRTEGIIIIPIIGLFFLIRKQYRALPWLLTGFVVYSIIGYFYFNDIFWLINNMPYKGSSDVYGTGDLGYFFRLAPKIFGPGIIALTLAGIILILGDLVRKRDQKAVDELILVVFPFVVYFMAHVVMWYSGIGRSLGLHRYMVAIVPVGALLALRALSGINHFLTTRSGTKIPAMVFSILLLVVVVLTPFHNYQMPQKLSGMNKVMKEASDFMLQENLDENKVYYYDPAFFYFLGLNPYDSIQSRAFVPRASEPHYNIREGEVVIWDGHFSPLLMLQLGELQNSPYFEPVKVFEPRHPFQIFGTDYKVAIFRRNSLPADAQAQPQPAKQDQAP
ncbi:MAG: glycosyltransferase family 87 protein [Bacteroidales bacterium]